MGFCAQTSCGQAVIKWKLLKDANKKGIYKPDQITENLDYYWKKHNPDDNSTVNKETAKKITRDTVNYLGSIGSGKKFEESEWEPLYKKGDFVGLEKNLKAVVMVQVTAMICTGKDDE